MALFYMLTLQLFDSLCMHLKALINLIIHLCMLHSAYNIYNALLCSSLGLILYRGYRSQTYVQISDAHTIRPWPVSHIQQNLFRAGIEATAHSTESQRLSH